MIVVIKNIFVTFFPRKKVTKEIFAELESLPAQASQPTGVAFGHLGDEVTKMFTFWPKAWPHAHAAMHTCHRFQPPSVNVYRLHRTVN